LFIWAIKCELLGTLSFLSLIDCELEENETLAFTDFLMGLFDFSICSGFGIKGIVFIAFYFS